MGESKHNEKYTLYSACARMHGFCQGGILLWPAQQQTWLHTKQACLIKDYLAKIHKICTNTMEDHLEDQASCSTTGMGPQLAIQQDHAPLDQICGGALHL